MSKELQAFIDNLEDGVVLIDRKRRILQINQAMRARIADAFADPLGQVCGEALPCHQWAHQEPGCPAERVFATGRTERLTCRSTVQGREQWLEVIASPLLEPDGSVGRTVEVWRDVTESKHLHEWYQRRVQELSALHLISAACSQSLSTRTVLDGSLDLVLKILRVDAGGAYVFDADGTTLRLQAYRSLSGRVAEDIDFLKLGEGFSGRVAEAGEPLIVDDVRTDPRLTRRLLNEEALVSLMSVPLKSNKGVLGAFWVASRQPSRRFTDADRDWLVAVGGHLALALENARLYEEARQHDLERQQLLAHVMAAQEEERKRVARGMHDEISQELAALAVESDGLLSGVPEADVEVRVRLRRLKAGIWGVLDRVYEVISDLRPGMLDDLGLAPAVRWFADAKLEPLGIQLETDLADGDLGLSSEKETALFRVMQEAIANVAQHSGAREVRISLERLSDRIVATIRDDGRGFQANERFDLKSSRRGLGLLGMRERLSLISGSLRIETGPGAGTLLHIEVPVDDADGVDNDQTGGDR